jgi:hypothetical protein
MLPAPHDLSLFISPGDAVTHLGGMPWRDRTGRVTPAEFYVVLHRRHGLWTHLYRVVEGGRVDRFQVFLEAAREGDARDDLAAGFFSSAAAAPPR